MTARIPKPRADYRLEEIEGEWLLYHPGETRTTYLNETAGLIWGLCDGERSEDDICGLLKESFPDAGESVRDDIRITLEELEAAGVLSFE